MASYEGLGIAITIFYIPAVLVAFFLLTQHARPRMAWITLFLFSCGVAAAAEILINVGVVPLLLSTLGQIRIIHALGFPESEVFRKTIALTRAVVLLGIGLLVTGAVLASVSPDSGLIKTGLSLAKGGYFVLAFVLIGIFVLEIILVWFIPRSSRAVKICYTAIAIALPFQIVRIIYALLGSFGAPAFIPLRGSIGVLVGLCLIMEYLVVILYGLTGWFVRPNGSVVRVSQLTGKTNAGIPREQDQSMPPSYPEACKGGDNV